MAEKRFVSDVKKRKILADEEVSYPDVANFELNQSEENKYIKSVSLNGRLLTGTVIKHADIMNGGEIIFVMMNKHQK